MNKKQQSGFTLIELVVVIVILGILAATALPRFIDMSDDAVDAAVKGVAGAISSGSAVNYAARKANSAKGVAVATCADAPSLLQSGALPPVTGGYTYSISNPATVIAADATVTCTVQATNGTITKTADAQVVGIP